MECVGEFIFCNDNLNFTQIKRTLVYVCLLVGTSICMYASMSVSMPVCMYRECVSNVIGHLCSAAQVALCAGL